MKNFDNIKFVRWGNINPIKHKEGRIDSESDNRGYHTAPCFKGIYAFPEGFIEPFLLGGVKPVNGKIANRCFYLRDKNGNKIKDDDFYDIEKGIKDNGYFEVKKEFVSLLKEKGIKMKDLSTSHSESDDEWYITYFCNKHYISYNGDIWSHLGFYLKENDIIEKKGSWYKTTYKNYIKALKRCNMQEKFSSYMQDKKCYGNPSSYPNWYSRDHYEVFIEKIK